MLDQYVRRAYVVRVVDGDTVWLNIDLGYDVHQEISCRLYGINCPEMSTSEGQDAHIFTVQWVEDHPNLAVRSWKDKKEKYGRYLVDLIDGEVSLCADLLAAHHAVEYML